MNQQKSSKLNPNKKVLGIIESVEKRGKIGLASYWNIAVTKSEILFYYSSYYSSSGVGSVLRGYSVLLFGAAGVLAEAGLKKAFKRKKIITINDLINKAKDYILLPAPSFKKLKVESKLFSKIIRFQHKKREVVFKLSNKQYKQLLTLCKIIDK